MAPYSTFRYFPILKAYKLGEKAAESLLDSVMVLKDVLPGIGY